MSALLWDQVGDRLFETGIDKGVLYLENGYGIAWNGLVSVSEGSSGSSDSPLYFDGVKYGDHMALGTFSASLKAYTYPDEFLEYEGIQDAGNGLFITGQQTKRFGLSYRTKIGDDETGLDLGYKIHILYNLTAVPSEKNYETIVDSNVTDFEWKITAVPSEAPGFRPTAHIILDSRKMSPLLLEDLESTLYGNELNDPNLPPIASLVSFIGQWVIIRITDNFDGTWTAEGPDNLFTMLDSITFQIIQANAVYLDGDTYVVSNSTF